MALEELSQSPYYDDYDETKNFYRILFKPGLSVQTRELNQLQTILQKQVERHGSHVFKEGALTEREKALIALAVAHAIQCPYCIDAYTSGSLEKGADEEQMMEAIHVAAAIRGGASLVHGVQMMNKAKEISM